MTSAAHRLNADLHCHSTVSDGVLRPEEVVRRAAANGVQLLALTDHDELDGIAVAAREADRLATALAAVTAEVEDQYAIAIDQVVVGDAPGDPGVAAVVQATREALINVAKHAQVSAVSLYAEVQPHLIEVFVRDRGVGFDETAVPADRQGLRGSILDRMQRHGGTATVRSTPGAGTEVALRMPRDVQ